MNIPQLISELRRDEGVKYSPYLDSKGIKTAGVGHNCVASPLPGAWKFPLTDSQVNQLLNRDLETVFAGLDRSIPWWRRLDDVRQRVLANMAFNLGVAGLLGFRNTLANVQRGAWAGASAGMRHSDWAKDVGARAERLAVAMETGVMPT